MALRFLIVEGSPAASRENYRGALGLTPAQQYGNVLVRLAGEASYDIVCPADIGGALPPGRSLGDYHGVAITGSPLHIWKMEPESLRQIELAREIFQAGVPFFGSCWGLQVAAVAAGGRVLRNPRGREFGYARRISLREAGQAHPMLAGRAASYDAPCSHLDEVAELPAGSTLLASNDVSRVQAAEIRHGNGVFWGVQYHPEYVHSVLAYILDQRAGDLVEEGFFANEEQSRAYSNDLRALDATPGRKDIGWRLGLNEDVLSGDLRALELRNFVARCRAEALSRGLT